MPERKGTPLDRLSMDIIPFLNSAHVCLTEDNLFVRCFGVIFFLLLLTSNSSNNKSVGSVVDFDIGDSSFQS